MHLDVLGKSRIGSPPTDKHDSCLSAPQRLIQQQRPCVLIQGTRERERLVKGVAVAWINILSRPFHFCHCSLCLSLSPVDTCTPALDEGKGNNVQARVCNEVAADAHTHMHCFSVGFASCIPFRLPSISFLSLSHDD